MIQSKTKLLPSNRELMQMCARAGISDAQEVVSTPCTA